MSYFDDHEDDIIFGRSPGLRRRVAAARERDNATCPRCGASPLLLRMNDNSNWQLFEQHRGERNRKVPHQCNPTTADDFDEVTE